MPVSEDLMAEVNEALAALPTSETTEEKKDADGKTNTNTDTGSTAEGSSKVDDGSGHDSRDKGSDESEATAAVSGEKVDDSAGLSKPETKTAEVPIPEPKPTISDYALTQAVQMGYTIEEAREFGSDRLLLKAVDMVRAAMPKEEKAKEEKDIFEGLPTFNPEEFDSPEVAKAFNALTDIVKKQADELKQFKESTIKSAETRQATDQEARAREITSWFNSKVNALGKDFEEALGKGEYGKLAPGSPQLAKRNEIADQVAVLLAGYQATGKQATWDETFDTAARLVLKDEFQKVKDVKTAEGLAKRETQHIQRAGGQKLKPNQNPLDEVAAMADDFIKQRR